MSTQLVLRRLDPLAQETAVTIENNNRAKEINKQEVIDAFKRTKSSYKRTRTVACGPFPIPAEKCVPTMASTEQIEKYEAQFVHVVIGFLGNQTIADLLRIFSYSDAHIPIGKNSFLHSFFQKIKDLDINLDVAILCNDINSENRLFWFLELIKTNCAPFAILPVRRDTFGVCVKIRRSDKPVHPIKEANAVDIVMVYDSAINVNSRVLRQFNGVIYNDPQVIYITTLDSADIRCYNSPCHDEAEWDTRYKHITIAQNIFHQPNRRPAFKNFVDWNNYIALEVAEWAAKKDDTPFRFYRPPKKSVGMQAFRSGFGGSHPLSSTPCKPKAVPEPVDATLKTSNAIAPVGNAPAKRKQKQKMKDKQVDVSSLAAAAAAAPGPLQPSFSSSTNAPLVPTSSAHATNASIRNNAANVTNAFASAAIDSNASSSDSNTHSFKSNPINTASHPHISSTTSSTEEISSQKRPLEEEESNEPFTSTSSVKRTKGSDRFMPAFDFGSVLDAAMQEFEDQLNSINTNI